MSKPSYYEQFLDFSQADLNSRLNLACEKGWIEEVIYLLTSDELLLHSYINNEGYPLKKACQFGHLEIVKYLLTSPDLKEHANIIVKDNMALNLACQNGHLDVVKYLLTSQDLKIQADISSENYCAVSYACRGGHLKIIKYLLTTTDLKEPLDIHVELDLIFRQLTEKRNFEALKYIIFELNINKTEMIDELLRYVVEPAKEQINKMFELRDLNQNLANELPLNNSQSKKVKL